MWELEFQGIIVTHGPAAVTWSMFEKFMHDQYGGGAIFDFIRKLSPAARKYVQDNAPEEWWTDVTQVHKKALNFALNRRAAVQGDPNVSRDNTVKKSSAGGSGKTVYTPAQVITVLVSEVEKKLGSELSQARDFGVKTYDLLQQEPIKSAWSTCTGILYATT
ncbi:hypothetical protein ABBQ32_005830 [Trebouxia sp. C0010 RCD-2024]